jgi:hypothetical protein
LRAAVRSPASLVDDTSHRTIHDVLPLSLVLDHGLTAHTRPPGREGALISSQINGTLSTFIKWAKCGLRASRLYVCIPVSREGGRTRPPDID